MGNKSKGNNYFNLSWNKEHINLTRKRPHTRGKKRKTAEKNFNKSLNNKGSKTIKESLYH